MYTVKELIEALQQCPGDYVVWIDNYDLEEIEIDHGNGIVTLFT